MNLTFNKKHLLNYVIEAFILTALTVGSSRITTTDKNKLNHAKMARRAFFFFLANLALFIFLDFFSPEITNFIKSGYGYIIGISLASLIEYKKFGSN